MMISTSFLRLLLLESLLLLLLTSYSSAEDSNATNVNATDASPSASPSADASPTTSADADANATDAVEFQLPKLEVQFICAYDIRPNFNVSVAFNEMYKKLLPDLQDTHLTHSMKINSMDDISPNKWYYSECNTTSPQVLTTLKVEGWAEFDSSTNRTNVNHLFNEGTIEDYFKEKVCTDMHFYRGYVENSKASYHQAQSTFDKVEHSLLLLCGGADIVYYDEEAPDAGFLFVGFFVGFMMVGMVATELQKYDRRPHPLGDRRGRRRDYDGVTGQELEMV
jgi:hypothetical protein